MSKIIPIYKADDETDACNYRPILLLSNFNRIFEKIMYNQEIMKVREVIPHTGPIPIVIPLNLFLDLLRDPVFPRGLTDSQSHVLIFTNVDS